MSSAMYGHALRVLVWLLGQAAPASPDWLRWSSPDTATDCGGPDDFASRVESRLGRAPDAAAAQLGVSVAIRIDILPDSPRRWRGELRTQSRDGTPAGVRVIERVGDSCEPIAASLALMTALVLQPGAQGPTPPAAAETPPAPPRPAAATSDAAAEALVVSPQSRPEPWPLTLAAGPGAEIGLLPGLVPDVQFRVTIRHAGGPAVFASGLVSASASAFVSPTQGATLSRNGVGIGGCTPELAWTFPELDFCAGGEIARVHAAGFGFDQNRVEDRWSFAVTADATLYQLIAGPLFAAVGVRLLIPLQHDRIAYIGSTGQEAQIYRTAPVAGSGQLLIGLKLE
jgi:hypothetical protein